MTVPTKLLGARFDGARLPSRGQGQPPLGQLRQQRATFSSAALDDDGNNLGDRVLNSSPYPAKTATLAQVKTTTSKRSGST